MIFCINAIMNILVVAITSTTQFSIDAKDDFDKPVAGYNY